MTKFWQIAASVAGIGGVGAFVFLSLFKGWLGSGELKRLTKKQLFVLFLVFLFLTFGFAIAAITAYVLTDSNKSKVNLSEAQAESYRNLLDQRYELGIGLLTKRRAQITAGPRSAEKSPDGGGLFADVTESVPDATDALMELDAIEADYKKYFERVRKCCDDRDLRGIHDNAQAFLTVFSEERLRRVFSDTVVTRLRITAGMDVKPKTETRYDPGFRIFIESLKNDLSASTPNNKTDAGNGSKAICRASNVYPSPRLIRGVLRRLTTAAQAEAGR